MSRAGITLEKWKALLEAFVADPGNLSGASIRAGVHWRTAQHWWERGGRIGGELHQPLSVIVSERQDVRRALVAEATAAQQAEAERLKAELREQGASTLSSISGERERLEAWAADLKRQQEDVIARAQALEASSQRHSVALAQCVTDDAENTMLQEATMLRHLRANIIALGSIVAGALQADVVTNLAERLASEGRDPKLQTAQLNTLLRTLQGVVKAMADSAHLEVQAERVLLGEPQRHVHDHTHTLVEITPEEYRRRVDRVVRREQALEDAEVEATPALPPAPVDHDETTVLPRAPDAAGVAVQQANAPAV